MQIKQNLLLALTFVFSLSVSCATPVASSAQVLPRTGQPVPLEVFHENASGSPLLPLLKSAKQSIDIEIYEMDDVLVHAEIRTAVDRGVKVRILKDPTPVGGSCKVFAPLSPRDSAGCQAEKDLLQYVKKGGGEYLPFNKLNLCGLPGAKCFQHGKMAIIDHEKALLTTGNFNKGSLCDSSETPLSCNRDYSVVSTDPSAVSLLSTLFEKDFAGLSYDVADVLAKSLTQKITVSPHSMQPLVSFILTAKHTVQIQNQYLKNAELNLAILEVAKRGVRVQVMVASACSFGTPSVGDEKKWTAAFTAFDQVGIKTRAFTRAIRIKQASGYLHAKAIVVDDARAWVGSVNGSTTSLTNNREFGIFMEDLTEVQKLSAFMYTDFADQNSETWQDSLACKNDPRLPFSGDDSHPSAD